MSDRSFFVDSRGESSTPTTSAPTTTAPTLGHVRHECLDCGAGWELGQTSCPKCHSCTFSETYVPPTLLERIGGRILGVVTPEKPVVKPLEPDDIVVFERCAAAAREFVSCMQHADRTARGVVNSDRASGSMAFLQDRLHNVSLTVGDFSASNMTSSMVLPTLTLATLIDNMIRQHQDEANNP